MRISDTESYFMPVCFGPIRPHAAGIFDDVMTLATVYETDRDAIARLLPEPFEVDDNAYVTVYYQRCRGVNFLAGGGYNLIGVDVAAVFEDQAGVLRGQFTLVLWENEMAAVIRGRELLGLPKLLADVPDPMHCDERWHVTARENNQVLLSMTLHDVGEADSTTLDRLNSERATVARFGWRYFPHVNGVGAALSQPQLIAVDAPVTAAWKCSAEVFYGDVSWESNPSMVDIVSGLKSLPVLEYVDAYRTQGTLTLTRSKHRVLTAQESESQ